MRINSLFLQNVMSHKWTTISLPDTGVVLVTGRNGAGKSAIIESVSMGLYGETLRGKSCWNTAAKNSQITVATDVITATRSRSGSRVKLSWAENGEDPIDYETTTKAQTALEERIIPAHVWRRVGVISSADATYFTIAPDQERKRLLEDILGLDVFDQLAEKAKARRADAARVVGEMTDKVRQLELRETALSAQVQSAKEFSANDGPPTTRSRAELEEERASLRVRWKELSAEIQSKEAKLEEQRTANAEARAEAEAAKRRRAALESSGRLCSACGSPISEDAMDAARHAEEHAKSLPTYDVGPLRDEIAAMQADKSAISAQASTLAAELNALTAYESKMQERADRVHSLEVELLDLHDELDIARASEAQAEADLAEYRSVEKIFSTRGIRSALLSEALSVVESAANRWLQFVPASDGTPLELKLSAYTEKKSGGLSDALALEVIGAGAGHGYKAASGGERRRIDLAIMLALQEIAEAAHGVSVGTVFIDEAFDALDAEVIPEAVAMLEELAKDRCVVVITHNENLVNDIAFVAMHLHVVNGSVTEN